MQAIAWINNQWGDPQNLGICLSDRGLRLAEGVFETLLIQAGTAQLLDQHLERWRRGAQTIGLPQPPDRAWLTNWLAEAIKRSGIVAGALRLNWSQGDGGGRGLALTEGEATGRFWATLHAHEPKFQLQSTMVSTRVQRWADSSLRHCKTFAYGEMALAKREANQAGYHDALLLSSAGGLCCGSSANLLVQREGRWLTPPLASGCLPGVMRGEAINQGLAIETALGDALTPGEPALLINSLDCKPITAAALPLAKPLFETLLQLGRPGA